MDVEFSKRISLNGYEKYKIYVSESMNIFSFHRKILRKMLF